MSKIVKPVDIPTADQGSLIMFSTRDNPLVICMPNITSKTKLTLTGAYVDNVVRIGIDANNNFVCETLDMCQTSQGYITVHAKTDGNSDYEGTEITFNFTVLVHGSDRAWIQNFWQFDYLEKVNQSFTPSMASGAYDSGNIINSTFKIKSVEGYESGLELKPISNGVNSVISYRIVGTGLRPGVYGFFLRAESHYRTTGLKYFVDGYDFVPIIIEIRQPSYDFGTVVLLTDNQYHKVENRLAITANKIIDGWLTEFLKSHIEFKDNKKNDNGVWQLVDNVWKMSFSVDHTSYEDVSEFYFKLADEVWKLYGRRYDTGNSVPEYQVIAQAPDIKFDGVTNIAPPRTGFTPILVVCGDTRYYVEGHGYFDFAGEHPVYGTYYQQQICYTPHWQGWENRPDEFINNFGRWLYKKNGAWKLAQGDGVVRTNDIVVNELKEITCSAIPYSPPRKFDMVAANQAITKPKTDEINLLANDQIAGGFFDPYVYHRLVNYSDGIDNISRHVNISASSSRTIIRKNDSIGVDRTSDYYTRFKSIGTSEEVYSESHTGGGSGSLNHSQNDQKTITCLSGYIGAHSTGGITHRVAQIGVNYSFFNGSEYQKSVESTENNTTNNCDGGIYVAIYYGSGPRIDGKKDVCTMTSARGQTNGISGGTKTQKIDVWHQDPETGIYGYHPEHSYSTTESYQTDAAFGFDIQNYSTAPCGVGGITPCRKKTKQVNASLTITNVYFDADQNPKPGNGTENFSIDHTREKHICGGVTAFEEGTTTITHNTDTKVFADNDGSICDSALASLGMSYQKPKDSWEVGISSISYVVETSESQIELS